MVKLRYIAIIGVLLLGVVVSGCADKGTTEERTVATADTRQELSVADEVLSDEMVGITDTELQDMETDLAELEALINQTNLEEEIVSENI